METLVGVYGNEDARFGDTQVAETSSPASSPREIANPVVYKLVRVDGDGRLVPATDDEVVEVEDLLEDDKTEMVPIADSGQTVGYTSNDEFNKAQLKGLEGQRQCESPEVGAGMSNAKHDAEVDLGKLNAPLEETGLLVAKSNDSRVDQSGSGEELSGPSDEAIKSGASTSAVCTNLKPDFSKLKGEICLDNLSVRELQETFKATFGRETSVKDKQWLKRRIAMGLTNSCDFSTMTFVIKDNKVVKKQKEESLKSMDDTIEDLVVGEVNEHYGGLVVGCNDQIEDAQNVSGMRLRCLSSQYDCGTEDLNTAQRAAKRVRKPTRRYIEELSEVESREYSGKLPFSVKSYGNGQASPRSRARPVRNVLSDGRPVVTRQDSLGGSGVQVPYVCRIRRSRPRENFMTLMKLEPNSMGTAAKLVKEALGACGPRPENGLGDKIFKFSAASGWTAKPLVADPDEDEDYLERKDSMLEADVELKHMDSSGDNSDDYVATVPTAKGGMRRKHHRPWTLSEVIKLVEGVARYGAGRWSEIKRLAFASYSYRTSVDLKDKWRNLLRASLARSPAENGMQNSRKHASVPIPAPILLRVRELAEMQSQVPPNLSSTKFGVTSGTNVHETRSGYL